MSLRLWLGCVSVVLACGCAQRPAAGEGGSSSSDATTSGEEEMSQTDGPPQMCETDSDCTPGNCEGGVCVICVQDADCPWSEVICMENLCEAGTCVLGPKDCEIEGCHGGYCAEGLWGDVCEIVLCDQLDGVVDVEIDMVAVDWTPPPQLDLERSVRVTKYDEPSCYGIDVVRALDGPLLLAHTRGLEPNSAEWTEILLDGFGEDWAALSAPLQIRYYDHESCPIVEDECGDSTRGIAELGLGLGFARIADRQVGWAPGGYFVNAHDMGFRDSHCIQLSSSRQVEATIMRDACTDDCPAPTVQPGCFAPLDSPHPAGFELDIVIDHWDYVHADFECVVVESSVGVTEQGDPLEHRGLDCRPLMHPTQHPRCEY